MCCLMCGSNSITNDIVKRKIRMHFCEKCRVKLMEKQLGDKKLNHEDFFIFKTIMNFKPFTKKQIK